MAVDYKVNSNYENYIIFVLIILSLRLYILILVTTETNFMDSQMDTTGITNTNESEHFNF